MFLHSELSDLSSLEGHNEGQDNAMVDASSHAVCIFQYREESRSGRYCTRTWAYTLTICCAPFCMSFLCSLSVLSCTDEDTMFACVLLDTYRGFVYVFCICRAGKGDCVLCCVFLVKPMLPRLCSDQGDCWSSIIRALLFTECRTWNRLICDCCPEFELSCYVGH